MYVFCGILAVVCKAVAESMAYYDECIYMSAWYVLELLAYIR